MAEERKQAPPNGGRAARMMPGEKAKDFKGTILTLFGYLKPYRWQLVVVFFTAILSTIFTTISPTILGHATDVVVQGVMGGSMDYEKLLFILLILLAMYIASWAFGSLQGWIMAVVSQKVIYTLRDQMSKKLDRLPLKYFDRVSYGEVQSRMINDIETINQTLTATITQIITAIVTLIGILIMMIRISLILTLAAMVVIPLSLFVIRIVVSKSQGHFKNQQKYLGKVNGHVEEMYSGHDIVKAFNHEEISEEEFNEYNDKLCEAAWKSQFLSGLMMPLTGFIGNLAYVMVCFLGGFMALKGQITIGQIQAFIQYVRSFNQPVQQVANIANQMQSTAAAAERIFELLDEEEEKDAYSSEEAITASLSGAFAKASGDIKTSAEEAKAAQIRHEAAAAYAQQQAAEEAASREEEKAAALRTEMMAHAVAGASEEQSEEVLRDVGDVGLVEEESEALASLVDGHDSEKQAWPFDEELRGYVKFENVGFGYNEDEIIINNFSFEARPGQRVAIVGPTGAGKTTVVKLLMRFYDINSGQITVDGHNIYEISRNQLRQMFGMVLQETWLNSSSIRDNIRYGRMDATDEEIIAAAKAAHIHHFIETLPDGYDTKINEEASNISAGQKQLLTIARAFLADAPILIFDEATSSVDTRTERQIQAAMARLMKGRTSFIIAHRLSTIKDADHILVMDHGDIIEQGSHEKLLAKGGFYANLYNSQFAK